MSGLSDKKENEVNEKKRIKSNLKSEISERTEIRVNQPSVEMGK